MVLQSKRWLLDDEFCRLFVRYGVEIGTRLDGPEGITDRQRGPGHFAQTMQGIRDARRYGMDGCIATFTPCATARWQQVFDFFMAERLNFSIHAAVPPLDVRDGKYAISPEQYGKLLAEMLDYYVQHRRDISVSPLDQMCQGFGCGDGRVCTFRDCLGMFLAIDPHGDIYSCRFCGKPAYRLGRVDNQPTLAALLDTPVARRLHERQEQVATICEGCGHFDYCKGGCPYNAWAQGDGRRVKHPYCDACLRTFDCIQRRTLH